MPGVMYDYSAVVVRVIDGDTVLLTLDLGFYVSVRMSCRLAGLNAIEHNQPGGREATVYLAGLLPVGKAVTVRSVSVDKYAARFDAKVFLPDGRDVGAVLVADGFAALWDGRGPRPTPAWPHP